MNEVKIFIRQDFKRFNPINPPTFSKVYKTTDDKSKFILHIFASFCIYEYYSFRKSFASKFFYTSIPIFVDTYFNNQFCFTFTQVRYKLNISFDKKTEALIRLKDGLYILKDINDKRIYTSLKTGNAGLINGINFERVFNTVQYQNQEIKKLATPILYTGMTN